MIDGDDRTEARVRAAFIAERLRAEADLQFAPLLPPARTRPRLIARLAAVAVVAVIAVAAAGLIHELRIQTATVPSAGPSSTPGVEPSPNPFHATPVPTRDMTGRYNDGIPRTFDGQPVLRWSDALAKRQTATDDTPFLAGVWLDIPTGVSFCPNDPGPDPSAPNSWIDTGGCQFNYVSTDAGGQPTTQTGLTTFRFYKGNLTTGPAIMRVQLHDPRANQCGYQEPICDDMIVVDDILWTGDASTVPYPLSVDQIIAAAREVSPTSDLLGPAPNVFGCGANVADGLLLCPSLHPGTQYTSPIAGAALLPSSEAVARALPSVMPGVDGALQSSAVWTEGGSFGSWDYRWLVVDNVAVLVRTSVDGQSDSDRAFLNGLVAALKTQETGPSPTN